MAPGTCCAPWPWQVIAASVARPASVQAWVSSSPHHPAHAIPPQRVARPPRQAALRVGSGSGKDSVGSAGGAGGRRGGLLPSETNRFDEAALLDWPLPGLARLLCTLRTRLHPEQLLISVTCARHLASFVRVREINGVAVLRFRPIHYAPLRSEPRRRCLPQVVGRHAAEGTMEQSRQCGSLQEERPIVARVGQPSRSNRRLRSACGVAIDRLLIGA